MTNSTKLLLSLFFLALNHSIQAQLNVISAGGTSFTPEELITNVFLGEGVTVTNITYAGNPTQVGYFNGAVADIGLDRGIVMTTGQAADAAGPQSDLPSSMAGTSNTDPDLVTIGQVIQPGADVNDVAVYEITFIPVADTLRFRYVFASEEYPEYVCTQFNDVFGFFISGPGISGAYSNSSENIALIPDPSDPTGLTFTTDPVSISNVNNGNPNNTGCTPSYPMYYNDNEGSLNLAYDGYTHVFTAQAIVQPCETYHIKLAIADLGDDILDTGVFLEAKSFGTGSVVTNLQTVSVDGTIVEGCSGAVVNFDIPNILPADLTLNYNILGNATHPSDFGILKDGNTFVPGSPLIIPAGDTMVSLDINALEDGLVENGEYIGISVQKDICTVDTLIIPIKDNVLVNPNLRPDTSICSGGQGATIQLNGDLGLPEPVAPTFTYTGNDVISNDLPAVNAPVNVFGVQPPTLADGVIRSVCVKLKHKFDADLDMFLFSPNNTPLLLSSDNGNNSRNVEVCFTPTGNPNISTLLDTLKALFPPNGVVDFGNINNLYFKGTYMPEGDFSDFWTGGANSPTNGQWRLMVFDDQGSSFGDGATGNLEEWSITFEPLFRLNYQWNNTTDLSCLDCPDPTLTIPTQTSTYTLTVSDTYGCSVTDSITVFVQDSLDAPQIDCELVGKDFITFSWASVPGAATYEISIDNGPWQNVGDTLSLTQNGLLVNQTVHIQVRAVGSCPAKIGTHECTTLDCIKPDFATIITPVNCNGSADGAIAIQVTSGVYPPYTYTHGSNTNTTGDFTNLLGGTQQIIITDSIGCTYPFDTIIPEPAPLVSQGLETQMVNCFGDQTGAGAIDVAGGVAPYIFSVNGGTDSIFAQASAGTYPYTVTDANGCQSVGAVVISENPEITFQTQLSDPSCFDSQDGEITIFNLTGGVTGYNFAWDDDQNQVTQTAGLLQAGTYAVTVTDLVGCTASASNLTLVAPTEITATFQKVDAVCGGAPGSATIFPTGGSGTYTYNWSDIGAGTDIRNGLAAGAYTVTISDQNNCSSTLSINIDAPSDMVLNMTETDVDCNGSFTGQTSVNVTGGSPPYLYQWNDAMMQTNKTAINLPAGLFRVVVTDNQQCVQSDSIHVAEPTELKVDTTIQPVSCFGASTGSIHTTVTGGTPPYSYEYTLPDNTTVQASNLDDIPAGTYQLTVTDDHNCQVQLSIIITEPAAVALSFANSDTICYGAQNGFAQVNVTGGTAPYTYQWNTSDTTQKITNLAANDYQVTVTDMAGCQYSSQTTILEHDEIIAHLSQAPALCHDEANGAAAIQEILVNGATRPLANYQFSWNTSPQQNTFDAYQLTGGQTYEVTITDQLTTCTTTQSIEIGNPDALTGKILQVTGVTCKGRLDGQAEITGVGGTPSYQYQWDASANNQTTAVAQNLGKGRYSANITDANGCMVSIEVEIDEPDAIQLSFEVDDVKCSGEATGSIQSHVNGGEQPYNYDWSVGMTTPDLIDITAGNYTLTVTDSRGCTEVQATDVTEPGAPLIGTLATQDITCHGGRNGSIFITPDGGTSPYQYSLNGESLNSNSNKLGLSAGDYQVLIQDARGCTTILPTTTLTEPEAIEVDLGPNLLIQYGDTLPMNPSINNAVGDLTYQWSTGSQESLSCFDCPAPYAYPKFQEYIYLTVIDENGCTADAQLLVNVQKFTKIFVPTGFSPNGDGQNEILYVLGEDDVVIESFGIFDRWGEQVFLVEDADINDITKGWDGTYRGQLLPTGQYAWQLKAKMPDGRTEILQGFSTLLR